MKATKWRKKLEKKCRELIIERDNSTCQHCGKAVEGVNCHVSHIVPRSYSYRLAFDLSNLMVKCFRCHINWWHKNPVEAGLWFKDKFPDRYEYLERRKEEVRGKGTIKESEYQEMEAKLNEASTQSKAD